MLISVLAFYEFGLLGPSLGDMQVKRSAGPVDANVGQAIRAHRLARGISQTGLAEKIGLTFQQIQKYEKGVNRVSVGRLVEIADALKVPVITLFDEVQSSAGKTTHAGSLLALLAQSDSMRLARAFSGISDTQIRHAIVQLVEQIMLQPK